MTAEISTAPPSLLEPARPSATPNAPTTNANTWSSWFYSFFSNPAPAGTPQMRTGGHFLEESDIFANWEAILSQEDQLLATKAKVERRERLQELASIQDAARGLKKLVSNEATYARLFGAPFLSNEELIACQNPLEPNTRSAIVSKLLHWYSGSYLKALQRIYFSAPGALQSSWDTFADQFQETKYKKGVIGSMKDIAVLVYHGAATEAVFFNSHLLSAPHRTVCAENSLPLVF